MNDYSSITSSLSKVRSQLPALNDSELKVANWVLQNPDQVIQLSMAQVAQECGVSDTTVLRFAEPLAFVDTQTSKFSLRRI